MPEGGYNQLYKFVVFKVAFGFLMAGLTGVLFEPETPTSLPEEGTTEESAVPGWQKIACVVFTFLGGLLTTFLLCREVVTESQTFRSVSDVLKFASRAFAFILPFLGLFINEVPGWIRLLVILPIDAILVWNVYRAIRS